MVYSTCHGLIEYRIFFPGGGGGGGGGWCGEHGRSGEGGGGGGGGGEETRYGSVCDYLVSKGFDECQHIT